MKKILFASILIALLIVSGAVIYSHKVQKRVNASVERTDSILNSSVVVKRTSPSGITATFKGTANNSGIKVREPESYEEKYPKEVEEEECCPEEELLDEELDESDSVGKPLEEGKKKEKLPPWEGLRRRLNRKFPNDPEIEDYISLQQKLRDNSHMSKEDLFNLSRLSAKFNPNDANAEFHELMQELSKLGITTVRRMSDK